MRGLPKSCRTSDSETTAVQSAEHFALLHSTPGAPPFAYVTVSGESSARSAS